MHTSVSTKDPWHIDHLLVPVPQTRADKITQLRRAVESGTYGVSAEQLAEKILREALVATLA